MSPLRRNAAARWLVEEALPEAAMALRAPTERLSARCFFRSVRSTAVYPAASLPFHALARGVSWWRSIRGHAVTKRRTIVLTGARRERSCGNC